MKIEFTEEVQYEEILFYVLREKGIHVWHHRPCFLTIAHSDADIEIIINAFIESIQELQKAGFIPNRLEEITTEGYMNKADAANPPVPGARLGKTTEGIPAWFIKDPDHPGKFLQLETI